MDTICFTDTHCHLAERVLFGQRQAVLEAAKSAGICRLIVPSVGRQDWLAVSSLASPQIWVALGVHPWFAAEHGERDVEALAALLAENPSFLLGEIGLDYHRFRQPEHRARQCWWLERQLALAAELKRPILLHNVGAGHDLVRLWKRFTVSAGGVVHAFSGSMEEARQFADAGLLLGIGTLLLNPNARKVHAVAASLPLSCMVLETDSPFMLHGETNTPANVRRIAETLAQLRGVPLAEIAEQTEANVERLLSFQAA